MHRENPTLPWGPLGGTSGFSRDTFYEVTCFISWFQLMALYLFVLPIIIYICKYSKATCSLGGAIVAKVVLMAIAEPEAYLVALAVQELEVVVPGPPVETY